MNFAKFKAMSMNQLLLSILLFTVRLCLTSSLSSMETWRSLPLSVEELSAVANFRSVQLSWKYPVTKPSAVGLGGRLPAPNPIAFTVKHCELVLWGRNKCISRRTSAIGIGAAGAAAAVATVAEVNDAVKHRRLMDDDVDILVVELPDAADQPTTYRTTIGGLRLATNYSFEVYPSMEDDDGDARGLSILDSPMAKARSLEHNELIVSTKSFSARPRSCLPDRTEVDIETGPYFGGHVSVEGAYDRRCTWIGDERDPGAVHTFVIDHRLCGGADGGLKDGRIETTVIVSESRSIITHTARRFVVVCNLVPETYTIKTSINIPGGTNPIGDNSLATGSNSLDSEVSYSEEAVYPSSGRLPSNNRRMASQHTAELRQMAQMLVGNRNETTAAHLILMVVLVVTVTVGAVATAWYLIGQKLRAGHFELSSATTGDDYEERLPKSCQKVVVVPMKAKERLDTEADDSNRIYMGDGGVGGICNGGGVGWTSSFFSLSAPSSISSVVAGDQRVMMMQQDRESDEPCLMHLEASPDVCATTLVLAPSMTAAFQSGEDSCC